MGQTALGVVSYAHVLGLPLVPVAKQALTACPFCGRTLNALGHSHAVDAAVRSRVFRARTLLPRFAGAFLLAACVFGLAGHFLLRHVRHASAATAALSPA